MCRRTHLWASSFMCWYIIYKYSIPANRAKRTATIPLKCISGEAKVKAHDFEWMCSISAWCVKKALSQNKVDAARLDLNSRPLLDFFKALAAKRRWGWSCSGGWVCVCVMFRHALPPSLCPSSRRWWWCCPRPSSSSLSLLLISHFLSSFLDTLLQKPGSRKREEDLTDSDHWGSEWCMCEGVCVCVSLSRTRAAVCFAQ